jgi:DNA-directed RNA polymerase subunit omega
LRELEDADSKFRFVIVAAKRAKQLLAGSKPKVKSKSKNLIRIAQEEVKEGLVDYEVVSIKKEDLEPAEDEAFIGEELGEGMPQELLETKEKEDIDKETEEKKEAKKKKKPEKKEKPKKEPSKTKKKEKKD